ncbi:MAG: LON peptidase substrate-binding domain-containing protein [Pseudomonadales bacterium]
MPDVALFPIPNLVAFPGTVVPLHVFEPRYRQMVQDCVRDDRMLGVSHVLKTIHDPGRQESLEQALSSNQATYKPQHVFSAGRCEIVDTTRDGRILARVRISERLVLVEERQSLPYRIVSCRRLEDTVETDADVGDLRASINEKLVEIMRDHNPDLARAMAAPPWTTLSAGDYSFRIFQYLRFDADLMQTILEERSPTARLETIWSVLRQT